jgi:hypothetical protein
MWASRRMQPNIRARVMILTTGMLLMGLRVTETSDVADVRWCSSRGRAGAEVEVSREG